jgi:glycolate oxidase FAD binding subunit
MTDISLDLQQSVEKAIADRTHLQIVGSGSKHFLGYKTQGQTLNMQAHSGITHYQPTELVITARTGTPLKQIEQTLAEHNQMLAFEPPYFDDNATLGGTIACGLSGPCRPFYGAIRDYVLGCKLINGHGHIVHFGGEVMKNVAGYDVSRLQVGAMGTLGIMLEASLKVLPKPAKVLCLRQQREPKDALQFIRTVANQSLHLSGLAYDGTAVHIRVAGPETAVDAIGKKLGGDTEKEADFWSSLREQTHHFFDGDMPLWRLSVPPASAWVDTDEKQIIDWAGGLRWLKTDKTAEDMFQLAQQHGGHAQLYRGGDMLSAKMQPLPKSMMQLHQRVKHSFDPHKIFNPGRLYPDL